MCAEIELQAETNRSAKTQHREELDEVKEQACRLKKQRDSRIAELQVSLAANEHLQAEYDGLRAQHEIAEEKAAHFERRTKQLQAAIAEHTHRPTPDKSHRNG